MDQEANGGLRLAKRTKQMYFSELYLIHYLVVFYIDLYLIVTTYLLCFLLFFFFYSPAKVHQA